MEGGEAGDAEGEDAFEESDGVGGYELGEGD